MIGRPFDARGSTLFETVLAFPITVGTFLALAQISWLELATLATHHAANEAARSACVVLADDPRHYDVPVGVASGKRLEVVRAAARFPLQITANDPVVRVTFPDQTRFQQGDQVRVRVEVDFRCRVPVGSLFVCGRRGTKTIAHEAVMPYQGAGYTYP